MKKINLFLIVLIVVIGGIVLYKQLMPNEPEILDETPTVEDDYSETREVGFTEPSETNIKISEFDLHNQIKNKRYLENTFLALEYSKVNSQKLVDSLENYLEDNTKMKPEDVRELIKINEKTFLNRYLKVFVSTPDEELNGLNNEMRRIFYQMKLGFDQLNKYGGIPVVTSPSGELEEDMDIDNDTPHAFLDEEVDVDIEIDNKPSNSPTNIEREEKRNREPNYDINDLRSGIEQLKTIIPMVDDAIKLLGIEDIKIEQSWLEAGISESDLNEVMDKTNIVNPELSEEDSFGYEEEKNREERIHDSENND